MIRRIYFVLVMAAVLAGCKSDIEQVEAVDNYGYTEKYARSKTDFAKQGLYEKYDSAGQIVESASFTNDTLDGLRVLYYENGDTQIVESHRMGQFDGPFRAYYENGVLEIEGQYVANEMAGQWKRYYDSGELMEVVTFAENAENGPFVEYYRNGNKKAEGTYRNGDNEHGLLKLYNEAGEMVRTMNCEMGICRTMWAAESEKEKDEATASSGKGPQGQK